MRIEHDEKCDRCGGTGLYVGMAEHDGFSVVCNHCKGTGCYHYVHEFEPFERRTPRVNVLRVLQTNPGMIVGTVGRGTIYPVDHFGGLTYEEWLSGKPFSRGTEMRCATCPAWWYQSTDYNRKPDWDECIGCGSFSSCKHFDDKARCWERFDRENVGAP